MKRNKSLKLVFATALAIFNLFVCFVGTYAWFVNATSDNAQGIQLQIEAHELRIEYELYRYNDTLNIVEKAEDNTDFTLLPFDSIIKERNGNTPLVMKIVLSGNVLANKTTSDINILAVCTNGNIEDDVLSNIVHFKFGSLNITDTEPENIYYQTIDGLKNDTAHKFVVSETIKNTFFQCTINAPINNGEIVIYSILNYDEGLVDSRHIDIDNLDEFPSFSNDIDFVRYGVNA